MTSYAEQLLLKALRCGHVYSEARLKAIFIERLYHSICFLMQNVWSANKYRPLRCLDRQVASLNKVQKMSKGPKVDSWNTTEREKSIIMENKRESRERLKNVDKEDIRSALRSPLYLPA